MTAILDNPFVIDDPRFWDIEPPPGYYRDGESGAWRSLPWPADLSQLPPTLGYDCIVWAEQWLVHHLTGEPWRFTRAQKRFLVLFYALDPYAQWLYRRAVMRRSKGNGKSPFAAAMLLIEMMGPVLFDYWDELGNPVGKAHRVALVQVAANSEAQAKDVIVVANAMVSKRLKLATGFTAGKIESNTKSGSRMQVLTHSEKSSEGDPATFIALEEPHHMTESSGGEAVAAVVRRNVAKSPGGVARVCEYTNAHTEGGEAVAEKTFRSWQNQVNGLVPLRDILYDSCEAPAYLSMQVQDDIRAGLKAAYADAPWVSLSRIEADIYDEDTTEADAIRYYFNATAANQSAWLDPRAVDATARPTERIQYGDAVALALDCSKSDDATTIVLCRISDGFVQAVRMWQKPPGKPGEGWTVPREEVDTELQLVRSEYRVVAFGGDPSPARDDDESSYWGEWFSKWHNDFRDTLLIQMTPKNHVVFDMRLSQPGGVERNRLFTEEAGLANQSIEDQDGTLYWDGTAALGLHLKHAHRRPNRWGISLSKKTRDSANKVDYAVTMVMARLFRRLVMLSGKMVAAEDEVDRSVHQE